MNRELTDEIAETTISKLERYAVSGIGGRSTMWMGICVEFKPRPKKDGGNVKRKKQWGVIVYKDYIKGEKEITREQAIKEILRP